jgi:hypothetical protein
MTEAVASGQVERAAGLRPALIAAAAIGTVAIGVERLWLALAQPLWFDETWTGAIAGGPGWSAFAREVWLDCNAPLYYLVMRAWTALFGVSNLALKAPGLIAVVTAAALPLLVRVRGLSIEARLTWGAVLFAWWGVDSFLDARCYGLLFALTTLQAIAFARLIAAPTRTAALAWCVTSALAILTQYYALVPAAVQGLVYLALHRERALRTWPAALAFVPAFTWIAIHAPRLAQYAGDDVAWHPRLGAAETLDLAAFTVGAPNAAALCLLAIVIAVAVLASRIAPGGGRDEPANETGPLAWTALSGLIALALVLTSGVLRPTLVARYLIPEVPALLLGVVLIARTTRRAHLAYLALAVLYIGLALRLPAAVAAAARDVSPYGLEVASQRLMAHDVTDVAFIWDHPAARIIDTGSLKRLGGFFFGRAGADVRVTPLYVSAARDPNAEALAATTGVRPGIIWIFDRAGRTAAHRYPPAIARVDPRWSCETIGDGMVGALACWRR